LAGFLELIGGIIGIGGGGYAYLGFPAWGSLLFLFGLFHISGIIILIIDAKRNSIKSKVVKSKYSILFVVGILINVSWFVIFFGVITPLFIADLFNGVSDSNGYLTYNP